MIASAETWSAVAGVSAAVAACISLAILVIQTLQRRRAHVYVYSERIPGERVPTTNFVVVNNGESVANNVLVKLKRLDNATHIATMPSDHETNDEIVITIGYLAPNSRTKRQVNLTMATDPKFRLKGEIHWMDNRARIEPFDIGLSH
jgi:hypothetical protein